MRKYIALIAIATLLAGCETKQTTSIAPVPTLPSGTITSKSNVIPKDIPTQYISPSARETIGVETDIEHIATATLNAPPAEDVPVEFSEGKYIVTEPQKENEVREIETEVHAVIDETGFTNRMLTLETGQTLVITNKSERDVWPFCAPYPQIDSGRVLEKNEAYAFKFSQPGLYPITDKLDTYNRMTVYVR